MPADPGADDALIGTILDDRYEVLRKLGSGGMGSVYEARHRFLKTTVAIKLLHADAAKDAESLERLEREARSASAIGSKHIVDVRDFGKTPGGVCYVAMERIQGVDLFRTLQQGGAMEWERVVKIAREVCEALGAAHAAGVVHRDLKAENVLLTQRGDDPDFVKVVDFGIAQIEGVERITHAGRVMGTPEYMSPEQCAGKEVDLRTDVYALGVMMYEMVTGRLPFASKDLVELVKAQLHETPAPPSDHVEGIPPKLDAAILRCLEKRAQKRFQTMEELDAALAEVDPRPAPPVPPRASGQVAIGASRETPSIGTSPPAPSSRGKWIAVAFGMTALGVAAVAVALGIRGGDDPEPVPPVTPEPVDAPVGAAVEPPAVPEPAPEVEAPAPTSTSIALRSTPSDAEVYEEGALLGRTPLDVARPEGDDRLHLELRLADHAPHAVTLSRLTAATLAVTLEREAPRTSPAARPAGPSTAPSQRPAPAGRPAPAPAPTPRHREFRDPWDDP